MATQTLAYVMFSSALPFRPTKNVAASTSLRSSRLAFPGHRQFASQKRPWNLSITCEITCKAQAVFDETLMSSTKRSGQYTAKDRVDILAKALPFIQKFQGKIMVVKYGGAAMKDPSLKDGVIKDLVLLSCVGLCPVLVHGGGPEINSWLQKLGIEPNFKNGLRVTDAATMEIVEMVL